jgi:hypothetical protein
MGAGQCDDGTPGGSITDEVCLAQGGLYVGGAVCGDQPPPCPVCEIASASSCQRPVLGGGGFNTAAMSDRSLLPNGPVVADDFVPQGASIEVMCVWGTYLNQAACQTEGDPECDCWAAGDITTNDFLIRVYADAGNMPGGLVGTSTVAPGSVIQGTVEHGFFGGTAPTSAEAQLWEYQLVLDSPIVGLTPGQKHWLEVSNNTSTSQGCQWAWLQTNNVSNNFSVHGINLSAPELDDPGVGARYAEGSERGADAADLSFCLDRNLDVPDPVFGGCCDCPPPDGSNTCTGGLELAACGSNRWDRTNPDCGLACDQNPPEGDTCTDMDVVVTGQNPFTYDYDSTCSGTDGPTTEEGESGPFAIGSDIWVHYIVPLDGRFYAHMCATGDKDSTYDSALSVYRDASDTTICACPGMAGFARVEAANETCNGLADGGSGKLVQPMSVAAGDCVTIRVAGFESESGRGTVHMGVVPSDCTVAEAPIPDPSVADVGFGSRNRYLSFSTGSGEQVEAMRVTFVELPAPFDTFNGDAWFVGQPFEVTEASSSDSDNPAPTFWAATLQCGAPHYDDWSQYGIVHAYDAGIIPGASYAIQAIAADCALGEEANYSETLVVVTSVLGDVAGASCGSSCNPPQGVVDFVDISAEVDKFKNVPAALLKSRADLISNDVLSPIPDRKVDFVDIASCVDAFRAAAPPLPGPQVHCP